VPFLNFSSKPSRLPYYARLTLDHSFIILFILFIVALEFNQYDRLNISELLFMLYALGFTLEKFAAMQEHGIKGGFLFLSQKKL
jgi:hypothetical protein